jgi:hypothetical protein
MKNIKILMLGVLMISLSSCLKEGVMNTDPNYASNVIEFANTGDNYTTSGVPGYYSDLGSVKVGGSKNFNINVHYTGPGNAPSDITVTLAIDAATLATYNAANGGSIVFNGTSSYANFNANIGSTNAVTVEMWVKTNSLNAPTGAMYFGFGLYDAWTYNGNIGYNTSAGDQYGISSTRVSALNIEGAWKHMVFVMYAGDKTNNKIYINGASESMSQQAGTFGSVNSVFNSGAGRISSWKNDYNWLMNLNVASFKIYNRELTAQEITNNFNSTKQRFYPDNAGLSPETASTSAYQIKQDYPNSPDGFYWIKNANLNGVAPFKIYADMTTDGGGWTLILKN